MLEPACVAETSSGHGHQLCYRAVSNTKANIVVGAALACAAALPLSLPNAQAANASAPPLLDVDQLKPGDKGYGLTVFQGTEPERFEVEVISVLHNFLPNQDLVLIKARHPRLEVAKVVAGMSGSPVFINGKMIGAYAYGWQFGSEPVAGVTPIKNMLEELQRPIPSELLRPLTPPSRPRPGSPQASLPPSGARFAGNTMHYDLHAHAKQVASAVSPARASSGEPNLQVVATPLMIGGMGPQAVSVLREALSPMGLEPLQGGGQGNANDPNAPSRFVEGGALSVQLVRGDMSAAGMGTVTRMAGNRLLAFGHPMMNGGVSRLPAALGKVHWVLASEARSFKIGEPIRPLGSVINDRQAAIVADSSVEAPLFPVSIDIEGVQGAPRTNWNMEVAHERFMAPLFVAMSMGNAVDATTQEKRDVTWESFTDITVRGRGTITLHDFGVAAGGTPKAGSFMQSRAVSAVGELLNNPWEPVDIESVKTRMKVRFARDLVYLRGVEVLDPEVDAGAKARLRLHMVPFDGPVQTQVAEVYIPPELAGQEVEIELNPGYRESPEIAAPENVAELMAALPRQSYPPDVLVASVVVGGQGVAYRGQVATRLPPGVLDTLRPETATVSPTPVPSVARTVIPVRKFIAGDDKVKVRVRNVMR